MCKSLWAQSCSSMDIYMYSLETAKPVVSHLPAFLTVVKLLGLVMMRLAYGSLMQSGSPRAKAGLTWQLLLVVGIPVVGCMLLFPLYANMNQRYIQTARILSGQQVVHRGGMSEPEHLHMPDHPTELRAVYPSISLSRPYGGFGGKKGSAGPDVLEEPIWRRAPVRTSIAASKVMLASLGKTVGLSIDASRSEESYQSTIDSLTSRGHMGPAVAAATAASSQPKKTAAPQVSPRLKHAVELAAREHLNGYQLTGGVRPRNQTSKKHVQALKTLRGDQTSHSSFIQ